MGVRMMNIHWGVYFRSEYFTERMLCLTEQTDKSNTRALWRFCNCHLMSPLTHIHKYKPLFFHLHHFTRALSTHTATQEPCTQGSHMKPLCPLSCKAEVKGKGDCQGSCLTLVPPRNLSFLLPFQLVQDLESSGWGSSAPA